MDIIDGPRKWGSLVNKTTNAFNGMIGMIQRGVINVHSGFMSYTYITSI